MEPRSSALQTGGVSPQVLPPGQLLGRDAPGQGLGQAVQDHVGELGEVHVVLYEDALRLGLDLSGLAQALGQTAGRWRETQRGTDKERHTERQTETEAERQPSLACWLSSVQ